MESKNNLPEKKLSLVPEPSLESMQGQINTFNIQIKTLLLNPEKNVDLIKEITDKMNTLMDVRDAKYTVGKIIPNKIGMSQEEAGDVFGGDIFKRGNA